MKIALDEDGAIRLPSNILKQFGMPTDGLLECSAEIGVIHLSYPKPRTVCPNVTRHKTGTPVLNCFGRFTIEQSGEYIHLNCGKARELLALLLVEKGRPMRKERVAGILWPENETAHALDNLYKTLKHIRALDPQLPLETRRGEIRLASENLLADIILFENLCAEGGIESLERAAAMYAAPLLADEYYSWTTPWQTYYDAMFMEAAGRLISHYKAAGHSARERYFRSLLEKV
ncbi:MAG: hypothetical protein FWH04_05890 [Oscillospiraceae bacterium]|nr:hypothetical protein [Oscillospiraceae bacterium]